MRSGRANNGTFLHRVSSVVLTSRPRVESFTRTLFSIFNSPRVIITFLFALSLSLSLSAYGLALLSLVCMRLYFVISFSFLSLSLGCLLHVGMI